MRMHSLCMKIHDNQTRYFSFDLIPLRDRSDVDQIIAGHGLFVFDDHSPEEANCCAIRRPWPLCLAHCRLRKLCKESKTQPSLSFGVFPAESSVESEQHSSSLNRYIPLLPGVQQLEYILRGLISRFPLHAPR